jgi:heme exporter protein CcmD
MKTLLDFLAMGGYAEYVWSAYGLVAIFLIAQWFFPWRRWRQFMQQQTLDHATAKAVLPKKVANNESYP